MLTFPTTARSLAAAGLAAVTLSAAACGGADENAAAEPLRLPPEAGYPEGVATDPRTGDVYVGSTVDGTVYRANLRDGRRELTPFLAPRADGREAVTGMKVDPQGRLVIAGRSTGRIFVYDTGSGALLKALSTPPAPQTLINDIAFADGAALITDSLRGVIWRLELPAAGGVGDLTEWLDLRETEVPTGEGFGLNGIVASADGRFLLAVHTDEGGLYRVDTATRGVTRVDLGEARLTTGDGMLLDGTALYVIREQPGEVVPIRLSADGTRGTVGAAFRDPSFRFPTTMARLDDRLLVVNSQFDRQPGDTAERPFTVSDVPFSAVIPPPS